MEGKIEMKKRLVEERTPVFEELERVFEERTNEYNALKKNIASMWNQRHFFTDLSYRNKIPEPGCVDIGGGRGWESNISGVLIR